MKTHRIATAVALAPLLWFAPAPAPAQMLAPPGTTVYYRAPAATYVVPRGYVATGASRGTVLPGFSQRGGIGTTPYLGNIQGFGANSTNFDAVRSGYPAAGRRWYRRGR